MNVLTLRTVLVRGPRAPRIRLAAAFICILSCAGCGTSGPSSIDGDIPAVALASGPTQSALQRMLELRQKPHSPSETELLGFYRARDFRPVWTGSTDAEVREARVALVLQHAYQQGLYSEDYPVDAGRRAAPKPGRDAALFDLTVTESVLRYAHDVRLGRVDPHAVYKDAELPAQSFDAAAALGAAVDDGDLESFLASLPPQAPQYRALVAALARYRAIAADGGWPRLSLDASPRELAKRLAVEDRRLAAIAHPAAADVKAALEGFQARHGLEPDGRLGDETLKALNVPVSYRIEEIAANMERWRWMPPSLEDRYIWVDVPDQSVRFVEDGKSRLRSKVIIGQPGDNRTPILRTTADAVVVNPPWDIPDDIAARAILPHLRKDPDYLATRNMVLVGAPQDDPKGTQIDWRKVKGDNLPYQIREQPGPHNVLGALMLDMPNDFDVYLHGTSNAATFDLSDRERSHGCVRVQEIVNLATLALEGSDSAPDDGLKQDIASGGTQRIPLAQPVPVYLLYWTAHMASDGTVEFRPDRYDRDPPLIARLTALSKPSHRRK